MFSILKKIDLGKISSKNNAELRDMVERSLENAEHIGSKADDILYQDFCPMYNNGKGGTWISETKEIVNPYEGSKMINCGSIKKEL